MKTHLKFCNSTLNIIVDDQEKARRLLERFEQRAQKLVPMGNNITDFKLALISAIILEEEFEDVCAQMEKLQKKVEKLEKEKRNHYEKNEDYLVNTLNYVSSYLENIANKFKEE